MEIVDIFRPLALLEHSLSDLYGQWSLAFEDDAEASFAFMKLASEERGHALLVEYQERLALNNPDLYIVADIDLGTIRDATERVRDLRARSAPSLIEAISIAAELEMAAAESHYRNALGKACPDLARLLNSLGAEDRGHMERLVSFARARGVDLGIAPAR